MIKNGEMYLLETPWSNAVIMHYVSIGITYYKVYLYKACVNIVPVNIKLSCKKKKQKLVARYWCDCCSNQSPVISNGFCINTVLTNE